MPNNGYSLEVAKTILDKLNSKGWNLYKQYEGICPELTIQKGPATELELETHYTALPAAENPKDDKQVFAALENLAQKLDGEMPTITVDGESHRWTGLMLHEDYVQFYTEEGNDVSYHSAVKALDTIISAK